MTCCRDILSKRSRIAISIESQYMYLEEKPTTASIVTLLNVQGENIPSSISMDKGKHFSFRILGIQITFIILKCLLLI